MENKTRLIVVDDHPLYRDGVVRTLEENNGFEIVGTGDSCASALLLAGELKPDLALIDISMPGGGLRALQLLGEQHPDIKVIVLTVSESDSDVLSALSAGARGYVLKGVGGRELADIVAAVAAGGSHVSPALAARVLLAMQDGDKENVPSAIENLTAREEQILRLVVKGQSNKEVARELDLSEKTIKHHMTRILQKLNVRNRVEAAVLARDYWV